MDKIANLSSEMPLLSEPEERLTMSMAREAMEEEMPMDSRFKGVISTPVAKYDP